MKFDIFRSISLSGICFAFMFWSSFRVYGQSFDWTTLHSGSGWDQGYAIDVDEFGNIITCGYFEAVVDFNPQGSPVILTSAGDHDVFVSKSDKDGNLLWVKKMGGSGQDRAFSLEVDDSGAIYVTGRFSGTADFDPGPSDYSLTSTGGNDIFVCKLNSDGDFVWAVKMGGGGDDFGMSITVDQFQNCYLTGGFQGNADFDPGMTDYSFTSFGDYDMFIVKLDVDANFVWAKHVGGIAAQAGYGVVVSPAGDIYLSGYFQSTSDFDPGAGVLNLTSVGGNDAFILKMSSTGDLVWARQFGGSGNDNTIDITCDNSGNIIATGSYSGSVDFDPGASVYMLSSMGYLDVFNLCLDDLGNFLWARSFGGLYDDEGRSVIVADDSNIYTAGYFQDDVDFDSGAGINSISSYGGFDGFLLKTDGVGNFVNAFQIGGILDQGLFSVVSFGSDEIAFTGYFQGTCDFDPDFTTYNLSSVGGYDVFIEHMTCATESIIDVTSCNSYLSPSGNYLWLTSGFYVDTVTNVKGCDSIISINLTIQSDNLTTQNISACDSYYWSVDGNTYNTSGLYSVLLTNQYGCDSLVELDLTINSSFSTTEYLTGCGTYLWPENMTSYSSSGLYSITYTDANGCDSTLFLDLIIGNTTAVSISFPFIEVCENSGMYLLDGYASPVGGFWSGDGVIGGMYFDPATAGVGTHSLTYTYYDINAGCQSSETVDIDVLSKPMIALSTTNASCGQSDGSVDATITGGTLPYTIYWSNGESTEDISNLDANMYYLFVSDSKGCQSTGSAMIESSGLSVNGVVTDVTCSGQTNGAVNLSIVSSAGVQSIQWTNGAATEDISNLSAGVYEVLVTDNNGCVSPSTFTVNSPSPLSINFVATNSSCGNADGSINATVTGGTGPYIYQWYSTAPFASVGTNSPILSSVFANNYMLTVTDDNGCVQSSFAAVSDLNGPQVMITSVAAASCLNNGAINISVNSSNGIAGINWSNGESTEDISGLSSGTYSVIVTDILGCQGTALAEVGDELPASVPICLVTVDTLTNTNLVVWEKPVSTSIHHFNIYRETAIAGQYMLIDSVMYGDESVYNDITAFPHIRSWRYKISTVNNCGVESDLSEFHKTIHLTIGLGLGTNINLNWDAYEGFSYSTFDLWRHTSVNGWELIQSLPSSLFSYTDNPPSMTGLDYMISITPPSTCQSSNKVQDHNSSRSNKTASITGDLVGTPEMNWMQIFIHPNPSEGLYNLTVKGVTSYQVQIFNAQGRLLMTFLSTDEMTQLDLLRFTDGVYTVQVLVDSHVYSYKLIKQ